MMHHLAPLAPLGPAAEVVGGVGVAEARRHRLGAGCRGAGVQGCRGAGVQGFMQVWERRCRGATDRCRDREQESAS